MDCGLPAKRPCNVVSLCDMFPPRRFLHFALSSSCHRSGRAGCVFYLNDLKSIKVDSPNKAEQAHAITCPKCSYTRREREAAPQSQCPACGIVYKRYISPDSRARAVRRSWLAICVIGTLAWSWMFAEFLAPEVKSGQLPLGEGWLRLSMLYLSMPLILLGCALGFRNEG